MDMRKYRLERSLRRSLTGKLPGIAVLLLVVALAATHLAGWWQVGRLVGTARWEARAPELLQRVSLSRVGAEGNNDSFAPSISADGRYVVFLSTADNLVDEDHNDYQDVFLFDRAESEVMRLTVGYDGSEANGPSSEARISRDGRFVVFVSDASNLTAGDDNGHSDVFLFDRRSGQVQMVSAAADGEQGNGRSVQPAISGNGHFVAFVSLAENLVEGDHNQASDVFVYDVAAQSLALASINSAGEQSNATNKYAAISADGRYVVFQSKATNLADGDQNTVYDIYLHDRRHGVTELVSRGLSGGAANHESQRPSISDDGRFVVFESWASDLVDGDGNFYSDVFLADRESGRMQIMSVGNEGQQADNVNGGAVISGDGRYVAFSSLAGNLTPNDFNRMFDVYVRDRVAGDTRLVSVNMDGQAGSGSSISPSLTAGASYIVFDSLATDLVNSDDNGRVDVFIFNSPDPGGTASQMLFLPMFVGR